MVLFKILVFNIGFKNTTTVLVLLFLDTKDHEPNQSTVAADLRWFNHTITANWLYFS